MEEGKFLKICPLDECVTYCNGECEHCDRENSASSDSYFFGKDCCSQEPIDCDNTNANLRPNKWSNLWDEVKNNFESAIYHIPENKDIDNVNHPSHYTTGKYEVIDILKDKLTEEQFYGFLCGNVLKYMTRWQHKNGLEDLKKAQWYLNKLISEKSNEE